MLPPKVQAMIVDAYTHMIHPDVPEAVVEDGGAWGERAMETFERFAGNRPQLIDLDTRLDQLADTAIDRQVITPPHWFDPNTAPDDVDRTALTRTINDGMARLADASNGQLIALGVAPMDAIGDGGREELDRALDDLGLRGFLVPSNARGRPLDDPAFEDFWAAVEARDVPVYLHPADPPSDEGRPYETDYDLQHNFGWPFETTLMLTRLIFSGVLDRYPDLDIVSHHLGGMVPFFMGRTTETYQTPREATPELDRPIADYYRRFYYDTAIGGSEAAIRCGLAEVGADRMLLATDAPFGPPPGVVRLYEYPDLIEGMDLDADDEAAILGGNAASLFDLDA